MKLFDWAEGKIQKMSIWDFSLTKVVLIILGMIIGAYLSAFVKEYIWSFVALFVLLYAFLFYRVLWKK